MPFQSRVLREVKPDYFTFSWDLSQIRRIIFLIQGYREERTCFFGLGSFSKVGPHSIDSCFLPYCLFCYCFSRPLSWLSSSYSIIYLLVEHTLFLKWLTSQQRSGSQRPSFSLLCQHYRYHWKQSHPCQISSCNTLKILGLISKAHSFALLLDI